MYTQKTLKKSVKYVQNKYNIQQTYNSEKLAIQLTHPGSPPPQNANAQ